MTTLYKVIVFGVASIGIIWISRSSLRDVRHHGFYRFFAWETILILFLMNVEHWFVDPFGPRQIVAWSFLIVSLVLIVQGVTLFRRHGRIDPDRNDRGLVGIEKTTELVTTGVYRFIRHPFYSSLLFLGWGIFFKDIHWIGAVLAVVNTILLTVTARIEERENIRTFGKTYQEYMTQTKMFVPYVF